MKTTLLFLSIMFTILCQSQIFSFKIYFTDSQGNKDTLTLGYDNAATDEIDVTFGEINIISTPLNSNFDVRITDEFILSQSIVGNQTFHTKKNIVNFTDCNTLKIFNIDIKTDNWPVTATWDSTLFNNPCLNGTVFSSMIQWWDVPGESNLHRVILKDKDSVTFTANRGLNYFNENCSYINATNDTISVFQIIMSDSTFISLGLPSQKEEFNAKLYPNPFTNILTIENQSKFSTLNIYSINGTLIFSENKNDKNKVTINTSQFEAGLYFYECINSDGDFVSRGKVIKQ